MKPSETVIAGEHGFIPRPSRTPLLVIMIAEVCGCQLRIRPLAGSQGKLANKVGSARAIGSLARLTGAGKKLGINQRADSFILRRVGSSICPASPLQFFDQHFIVPPGKQPLAVLSHELVVVEPG